MLYPFSSEIRFWLAWMLIKNTVRLKLRRIRFSSVWMKLKDYTDHTIGKLEA